MESKYPNLDFVLVAVGNDPKYAQSWGEQKIRNYYLNDTQVWNDVKEWQRIFTDLGLISEVKTSLHFKVEEYARGLCGNCEYCQRKKLQLN